MRVSSKPLDRGEVLHRVVIVRTGGIDAVDEVFIEATNAKQRDVIRECGRPVLIIPADYQGPEIGEKIVLGWSETREAARAALAMVTR